MRTVRNLDDYTKSKISNSMKQTKKLNPTSDETKRKISDSMKKYWGSIPTINKDDQSNDKDCNKKEIPQL